MNRRTEEQIRAYVDGYNDCFQQFYDCLKHRKSVMDAVKKMILYKDAETRLMSLEPENDWIPCSERLPKTGEYVGDVAKYYLVQNEFGDMMVARYTYSKYWEQMYQLQPIKDKIVAWMPLPDPYKGDEE